MKKVFVLLIIFGLSMFYSCNPENPSEPDLNITTAQLALSKMVAVGNSITAGFQSSGMLADFQMNSYSYLVAQQMGMAGNFQQNLVSAPGIGSTPGRTPQSFNPLTGEITDEALTVNPLGLLPNIELPRPFDNLGVPGSDLNDMLNTTASLSNPFFSLILRNPNFGNTTQLDQVISLSPTVILLWIGNNDVLGAALDGGDLDQLTDPADFQTRFTSILTRLRSELEGRAIFMANIPNVTDIPYVNTLDIIFRDLGLGAVPVIFDATFQPIDFGGGLMLPIMTEETGVAHITLPGLLAYQAGIGVPDSAALVDVYGLGQGQASQVVAGLIAAGANPTGTPIAGDMTITSTEATAISGAVDAFNAILVGLAGTFQVPLIDANTMLNTLNTTGLDGASGRFVLLAPHNTAFSLDGVHPSNAGQAIIANAFINVMNATFASIFSDYQAIPTLTVASYLQQYAPAPKTGIMYKSNFDGVRSMFRR